MFYMTGQKEEPPKNSYISYVGQEGTLSEDISAAGLDEMGHSVRAQQGEMPDDFWCTGHIDGEVEDDGEWLLWEHKHFGVWGFTGIFRKGLMIAKPEVFFQGLVYAMGRGLDKILFQIVAQDSSATQAQATQSLKSKKAEKWGLRPDWNPKVQFIEMDVSMYKETVGPALKTRAQWLSLAKERGTKVAREYDPHGDDYQCTYCPFKTACLEMGDGGTLAPGLPV